MPQPPIMGFTGFFPAIFKNTFTSFAKSTPPMVSNTKATRPSPMIMRVAGLTNCSALILKEMVIPSIRVMILASSFWAARLKLLSTPHSLKRFPNMRKPTNATDCGEIKPTIMLTAMGKAMRSALLTLFGLYSMWMHRSLWVVTSRMAKGWMIGTRAM